MTKLVFKDYEVAGGIIKKFPHLHRYCLPAPAVKSRPKKWKHCGALKIHSHGALTCRCKPIFFRCISYENVLKGEMDGTHVHICAENWGRANMDLSGAFMCFFRGDWPFHLSSRREPLAGVVYAFDWNVPRGKFQQRKLWRRSCFWLSCDRQHVKNYFVWTTLWYFRQNIAQCSWKAFFRSKTTLVPVEILTELIAAGDVIRIEGWKQLFSVFRGNIA